MAGLRVCGLCGGDPACPVCAGRGVLDEAAVAAARARGILDGFVSTYSAQGMEGEVWRTFQDGTRINGDQWAMDGMHPLQVGDRLWVWEPSGALRFDVAIAPRRRLFRRPLLPSAGGYAPPGMEPEVFAAAFEAQPPLRAWLER